MAIKLNTPRVIDWLKANDRPVAWLAKKIGVSPEVMRYRLEKCVPGDADAIATAIGEPDPKSLLMVGEWE